MEGAPHECRCYACLTPAAPRALVDAALPGLCVECRRKSRTVRERLAHLFCERFNAAYFALPRVDPPVPKVRSRCPRCGMTGTSFGWTRWREAAGSESGPPTVEGDAYSLCVSCETLNADPWRREAPMSSGVLSGGSFGSPDTPGGTSSFMIAELIGLFLVSIVILAMLM